MSKFEDACESQPISDSDPLDILEVYGLNLVELEDDYCYNASDDENNGADENRNEEGEEDLFLEFISEEFSRPSSMDMDVAMEEARAAVNFFFNNKFDEAKDILKPW
uniref:Uncharacterized protein n=1 Tax=Timema shepardi TaxID=629360 RepID=A0A7R9B9K7_TIMSH|nr:unnamed protein product [Timema shepardi]